VETVLKLIARQSIIGASFIAWKLTHGGSLHLKVMCILCLKMKKRVLWELGERKFMRLGKLKA